MQLRIAALSVSFALFAICVGCATNQGRPTKVEVDQANQICTNQILADRAARARDSFSHWLSCKEKHFMPLEIRQYPGKESQIREMYKKLYPMALAVDRGWGSVETVYDQWDQMKAALGMDYEVCAKQSDGSQKCIAKNGASLYLETKDGDIVPFK